MARSLLSHRTRTPRGHQPTDPAPAPVVGKTMKAIVQDEYGCAEDVLRLAEIAPPTIGDDEILVCVAAAGVDRGTKGER